MNIWIFNHYAISPDLPGSTRHYDLGRELVQRGHQVVIIATSFHHYMHKETRLKPGENWKVEDVNGVKFVWLRTPPYWRNDQRRVWNMVVFALRAWWMGRRLAKVVPGIGKADVLIGYSPHLLTPLTTYWVARHYGVPFIVEIGDLWPQTAIDMGVLSVQHPVTKILQLLERFLYHKASRIISLLPFTHEYIVSREVPEDKIVWIPNGVDLTQFAAKDPSPRGSRNSFQVLYLGAHGHANALDVLLRAAAIVQKRGYSEIRFVLIGDGPEKPRLIELARNIGLHNTEFRNPVPKSEVPIVLQTGEAVVFILRNLALYNYGISLNKMFDYLAAGKPVILAGNPANNPVQESACGLVVPPDDPHSLAEAVIRLYQMPPEEREAMGRRGRAYVEEHHDIRKLARRLEQVLLEVVVEGRK